MLNPDKIYHGRPCKTCGSTLKAKHNCGCVECGRKINRERKYYKKTQAKYRHRYENDPDFRLKEKIRETKKKLNKKVETNKQRSILHGS